MPQCSLASGVAALGLESALPSSMVLENTLKIGWWPVGIPHAAPDSGLFEGGAELLIPQGGLWDLSGCCGTG